MINLKFWEKKEKSLKDLIEPGVAGKDDRPKGSLTLGEILDRVCRELDCKYEIHEGMKIVLIHKDFSRTVGNKDNLYESLEDLIRQHGLII